MIVHEHLSFFLFLLLFAVAGTALFLVRIQFAVAPVAILVMGVAVAFVLVRLMRLAGTAPILAEGLRAEERTLNELEKLAWSNWRIIENLEVHGDELHHVAIGPPGVLAVATAFTTEPWRLTPHAVEGAPDTLLDGARAGAEAVRQGLVEAGLALPVVPVLVLWGEHLPLHPDGQEVVDGVAVLLGGHAPEWRADLRGDRLPPSTVETAYEALAGWAASHRDELHDASSVVPSKRAARRQRRAQSQARRGRDAA